jgi:hypothetical protein
MRSHERRLAKLEKRATATDDCKGNNLKEIYDWEDSPEGQKAMDLLYNEPQNTTE